MNNDIECTKAESCQLNKINKCVIQNGANDEVIKNSLSAEVDFLFQEFINDIYMVEGETLALDLSSYFHNEIENDLTFVSNIGEIIDGIFKYTATELGIKKVTISAINTEGVTSTNKFLIVINSITGENNILYWNDFEHIPLRENPGFNLSLNAVFDTEGYFGVCEDDRGNRAFRSNHNCLYKGTNTATKIFERSVYGDFELSVDLTAGFIEGTSVTFKEFNILNPEGNILMGFGFCSPSNDKEYEEMPGDHLCAFGRSKMHIDNFVAEQDVPFHLNVKMESKSELLKVEINGSGRIVEIPLSNSNLISSKWGIGGISISTYYRAKTITGHYFQMDNIEVKADIPVNLKNMDFLKREVLRMSNHIFKNCVEITFKDYLLGRSIVGIDGWNENAPSPKNYDTDIRVIQDPRNSKHKVAFINNNHTGIQTYMGYTVSKKLPDMYQGELIFTMDIMIAHADTNINIIFINSSNQEIAVLSTQVSPFISQIDAVNYSANYTAAIVGRWYKYKIIMNTEQRTLIWYINDRAIAVSKLIENVCNNYKLQKISFHSWVRSSIASGFYINNIRIRENVSIKISAALDKVNFFSLSNGVENDFDLLMRDDNGVKIDWKSNHSAIKIDFQNGKALVTRPKASALTDEYVRLTAIGKLKGVSISNDYIIKVKRELTDDEAVRKAYETLKWTSFTFEPIDAITRNITLPLKETQNTTISWSSSNVEIISVIGDKACVRRPLNVDGNAELIARISRGSEIQYKTFYITVVRKLFDNLAFNATILNSSSHKYYNRASAAFDGNFGTYWSSLDDDSKPCIIIDFKVTQAVDSVLISELGDNIQKFRILCSLNNSDYTEIFTYTPGNKSYRGNKTNTQVHSFSSRETRYLKIEFTKKLTNIQIQIEEIQFFNSNLTDIQSVKFDKAMLTIYNSHAISEDIDLKWRGVHGTVITYESSNQEIVSDLGIVNRPEFATNVILTATIMKNGYCDIKQFMLNIIGKYDLLPINNYNFKLFDYDPTSISDQEFFGVWRTDGNDWDIESPGVLNYDYCSELKKVQSYVKIGDYSNAKSILHQYYKNRNIGFKTFPNSIDYAMADLYINNIVSNGIPRFLGNYTIPTEWSEILIDVTSYITSEGEYTLFLMQKYKNEPMAEFYSKEAESHIPILEIVADGKIRTYTAAKDTYISPGVNENKSYGYEYRLYTKETKAASISQLSYDTDNLWTSETRRAYIQFNVPGLSSGTITKATVKIYGRSMGCVKSDIIVWSEGNNSWTEKEFNWRLSNLTVLSWNGGKVDWALPTGMLLAARFNWINVLSGCYITTGDEYYAYHAIRQMLDHIEATKEDIGYPNQQDCAIKAHNFIIAFNSLLSSNYMTEDAAVVLIKYMWQLSKHLSMEANYRPDHNHGIFATRELMRLTLYWQEFRQHSEWKTLFIKRLKTSLDNLVLNDGSYREATTSYAQVVANILLSVIKVSKEYNFELDPYFVKKTGNLNRFLAHVVTPDGNDPGYGDGEIGRNHIDTIENIANMFRQEDIKYMIYNGMRGTYPGFTSKYYPDSMYVVMRDGYSLDAWMASTNLGTGDQLSHTHFDNLSLNIYAFRRPLITEMGRYNYNNKDPISEWLRYSTESHNVVNINNMTQGMKNDILDSFIMNEYFDFFQGTSRAVVDTNKGGTFTYQRSIFFSKSKFFIVSDKIVPPKHSYLNTYDQNWHFIDNNNINYKNGSARTNFDSGANIVISQADADPTTGLNDSSPDTNSEYLEGVKFFKRSGYFSPLQNHLKTADYATFRLKRKGTATFDTVLLPIPADSHTIVKTTRINLDVSKSQATALNITIKNKSSTLENVYYLNYETESVIKKFGNLSFDGRGLLVCYDIKNKIESVSIIQGKTLIENKNLIVSSPIKADDLFISIGQDGIDIYSSALNENNIAGLKIYCEKQVDFIKFNGNLINFTQAGNIVEVKTDIHASFLDVF